MQNKPSFSDLAYKNKKKVTRKQRFLEKMDEVLPWKLLLEPILAKYPKSRKGRPPVPARVMLRIYLMQHWYGLSDRAMEDSLYDVESMRRFAGVSMRRIPDDDTIYRFRRFLRERRMTKRLLGLVETHLSENGIRVTRGKATDPAIRRLGRKTAADASG